MFKKQSCPHCRRPGISPLKKMWMGPALPVTCAACRRDVGMPYIAVLAGVPFVAAIHGSLLVDAPALKAGLLIGGFAAMCLLQLGWAPLEQR